MNPVNATALYVSASRAVLQCDPRKPNTFSDMYTLLPFFRQSLACLVCGKHPEITALWNSVSITTLEDVVRTNVILPNILRVYWIDRGRTCTRSMLTRFVGLLTTTTVSLATEAESQSSVHLWRQMTPLLLCLPQSHVSVSLFMLYLPTPPGYCKRNTCMHLEMGNIKSLRGSRWDHICVLMQI